MYSYNNAEGGDEDRMGLGRYNRVIVLFNVCSVGSYLVFN